MIVLILLVLLLYVVQTFVPSALMARAVGPEAMHYAGGPRDEPLKLTVKAGRAKRALENMNEAMMIFIPLSLLAISFNLNSGTAWWGALVFLLARVAYIPAYLTAFGLTRSVVWTIGHAGLGMMAVAILQA